MSDHLAPAPPPPVLPVVHVVARLRVQIVDGRLVAVRTLGR